MPRNATTGVYARVSNSFSQPVFGTLIDPTDADAYFDDLDVGLNPANFAGPTNIIGALTLGKAGTTVGTLGFFNATTGSITLSPPTGALGTVTLTLPDLTDTLVTKTSTDILTNKTLTAPTINGGTHTAITSLGIRSTGTGAFDLTLQNSENLTSGRSLSIAVSDASKSIFLGGSLSLAGDLTTSGAFASTFTMTGTTTVTFPTSGTLVAQGGPLGTPSSGVATNLTGTAASLTAGNATNSAITNDTTTNATMFPAWVTANTGNLPMKVTSTKLTFNPSTGVLSSTSFTGAGTGLTGIPLSTGVTGNLPTANAPIVAAFSVHKNAVDQTGIADSTFTAVTWGTEIYDVGSFFASNAWTPPAGKIHLDCSLFISATVVTGNQIVVSIFKNGAGYKNATWSASSIIGGGAAFVGVDDIANGSDAYTVQVFVDTSSGTATVSGSTVNTFFTGHWISP